jgi:hypothetical protein
MKCEELQVQKKIASVMKPEKGLQELFWGGK